jgi:signal transduction histidine kinase
MANDMNNTISAAELRKLAEEKVASQSPAAAFSQEIDTKRLLHELQVHQVELEMQNEELRQAYITLNSERARSEETLRAISVNLKATLDATADGILAVDADGRIIFSSKRFAELWCIPQSILDTGDDNLLLEHVLGQLSDPNVFLAEVQRLYASDESSFDRIDFKDGRVFERYSFPLHKEVTERHGRVWSFRDISERRRSEDKIKQLNESLEERLAEALDDMRQKDQILILQDRFVVMGEMINNIAHQWRQPLNNLGLTIQQLPFTYDTAQFGKEYLEKHSAFAMEQICHMSDTIEVFRNFFKPDKTKVTFGIIHEICRTLSLIEGNLYDLNIKTSLHSEGDPQVNGYPNEFTQVLLNILTNARDALLENAIVNAMISIKVFSEEKTSVVTITDNAGGINDDIFGRIFDPFFTTKKPDKGTGIGLFMSKTIIEKHMGGRLTVHNSTDGAEFRIEL